MAPQGNPRARRSAARTFASFHARTAALSGAARAEAFDRLPEGAREEAWRALGRECAERAEHERLEGRASRPRPVSDYADYLRSAAWRERAVAAKARAGGRCALCGDSEARLAAHHVSYARVGSERAEDLTVLCAVCHEAFHDRRALAEKRPSRRAGSSLLRAAA